MDNWFALRKGTPRQYMSLTFGVYSGQNLTLISVLTHAQDTNRFSRETTTLRVQFRVSATPGQPKAPIRPEDVLGPEPLSPFWDFYHSEVFSVPKVSALNLKLQQLIVHDLRLYLCNAFLTHNHNVEHPYQCGQLWTVSDFLACNPNRPASMVTFVTTNSACIDRAVTTAHQFSLHISIHVRYICEPFSPRRTISLS